MTYESLFLGFDGGASKTTVVAMKDDRSIVAEETGGPSNFQIIGTDRTSENIFSLTLAILRKTESDFSKIKVMYLALTGAGRISDADRMRDGFVRFLREKSVAIPNVRIGSDAIAALEGAFSGKPGMILISGTGSILFAKDEDDRIHRVGGWGRFIGDEGSGYAIGRACLSAVAREFDGRGRRTALSRLLKEFKGIDTSQALIAQVYQNKMEIASLAPIVIQAAAEGDEVAAEITTQAAVELFEHVRAILPQLKTTVPLVLAGSVLSSQNLVSQKVREMIGNDLPNIKIQEPEYPPAVGAALLAFKTEGPI